MGKGGYAIRTRATAMTDADAPKVQTLQVITVPTPSGALAVPVVKGDFNSLPLAAKVFIAEHVALCRPKDIYLCDGSQEEAEELTKKLVNKGMLQKLEKMDNW